MGREVTCNEGLSLTWWLDLSRSARDLKRALRVLASGLTTFATSAKDCTTAFRSAFSISNSTYQTHNVIQYKLRKKDDFDVATCITFDFASFSSWSESIFNPETCITRIGGPPKTTASFQRWTPWMGTDKLACTYPPRGWLEISNPTKIPPLWLGRP